MPGVHNAYVFADRKPWLGKRSAIARAAGPHYETSRCFVASNDLRLTRLWEIACHLSTRHKLCVYLSCFVAVNILSREVESSSWKSKSRSQKIDWTITMRSNCSVAVSYKSALNFRPKDQTGKSRFTIGRVSSSTSAGTEICSRAHWLA